jgi:hypothetical protein
LWKHHFQGRFFDRIPLINKTSIKETLAISTHYDDYNGFYAEASLGIEDFKIGPFSIMDIEYTLAFDDKSLLYHGVVFRLNRAIFGPR